MKHFTKHVPYFFVYRERIKFMKGGEADKIKDFILDFS